MKKIAALLLCTILCLLLSACWSKKELNEIAIVVALGIDQVDDEYEITVQVVNPGEISSKQPTSGRSPVTSYSATGSTLYEAIRKVTLESPRKSYFAHLQMVILGKELVTKDIRPVLDFLSRDHEFRNDFNIIVAHEDTAKDIVSVLTPIEKIPANKITSSLKTSEKAWGSTVTMTMNDLITFLHDGNNNLVLSTITLLGNKQIGKTQANVDQITISAILQYSGLAVIKNGKMIGILTEEQSKSYNFLMNNIKSTVEIVACPEEGNLATEITATKTTIKGTIENDVPSFDIKVNVEQNVGEVKCMIDLQTKQTMDYINHETSVTLAKKIEDTLHTLQQTYDADVVHFGQVLHRQEPKKWRKIKEQWPTLFQNAKVTVNVKVDTITPGTIQNSTFYPIKESK